MRGSVCGADEVRQTAALQGRQILAQGKAQRRPGSTSPRISQALKGRHNLGVWFSARVCGICFALTGLDLFSVNEPRALPWAIILRPVGRWGLGRRRSVSEWKRHTFGELIDDGVLLLSDGYRAKLDELGGDGPMFLRAGHVSDSHIDFTDVERFHAELERRVRGKMSQPGDVVITTKGNSTGRVTYVSESLPQFVYSPHLSFWRSLQPEKLVPGFMRYWSRGEEFQQQLRALACATDMAPYLSLVDQRRLRLTLPSPPEQRAIALVLGALDDKIELNRGMNETLQAMAQSLFKSWFVDATRSGLPKGWRYATISELCEINSWTLNKGDELDRIEYVEISEVSRGSIANIQVFQRGKEPSRARRRLRHGDTGLSTVRPERGSYFLSLNPSPSLIASTGFAVVTPTKAPWSFIHAALTHPEVSEHLGQQADGGAYPAVRPEIIGKWEVPWPHKPENVEQFHRACATLYERAEHNRRESRTLAALRDALLPKLLSGEIRVKDAEMFAGRVR